MSGPTKPAPFAGAYIANGEPICVLFTRCEPCMYGSHPGGNHSWAGPEDIAHALATRRPNPSDEKCACPCADGPELEQEPEPDFETFSDREPCPVCGEYGACGYDPEGRPLIHTDTFDVEEAAS